MEERLQKYLANSGVASRRKCEELILQGKIQVNGNVVSELGIKVDPEKDKISFNGKEIKKTQKHIYILLNKPIGYVTTADDQFGRDTVLDLVKIKERIVPVGRLDMYTSGALILTNDEVERLRKGVKIDDYTKEARVNILKIDMEKKVSRLEITIHEGKNRQVRKMCEAIDKKVLALHRSKIGSIGVKDIELGKWRYLRKQEVQKLIK